MNLYFDDSGDLLHSPRTKVLVTTTKLDSQAMLFNSIEFALFLPLTFLLYWYVFSTSNSNNARSLKGKIKLQNAFIVFISYIFYGYWDYRFLFLIIISSCVDFLLGLLIDRTSDSKSRKLFLMISIFTNLGILGVFKYYNFFIDNFSQLLAGLGMEVNTYSLYLILPVGISFYTFQTLSYTIDIYRRKLKPTRDVVAFFAFVSFFPQLVAGPIERASHLLPQFYVNRKFDYSKAADGMRQALWGLFKKVVIADSCAVYVNDIFTNYESLSGPVLLLGGILFAFQIYGDFSGYSDIAIGVARIFGFDLKRNFAFPYFSRDIAEFWRRWHISLSTWFRDYVYIPLGGSKGNKAFALRNIFIIFLVSGFWHGANWTFVFWGLINALYFVPLFLFNKNRNNIGPLAPGRLLPSLKDFFNIGSTFLLTVIAWVFFRSASLTDAFAFLKRMATHTLGKEYLVDAYNYFHYQIILTGGLSLFVMIALLLIIEWVQRDKEHGLDLSFLVPIKKPQLKSLQLGAFRWSIYVFLIYIIYFYGKVSNEFIYFQF